MNILDLNDYIHLIIFEYVDIKDLLQLYDTCIQFRDLISRFDRQLFKRKTSELLLTGHNNNGKFTQNTFNNFTYMKRMKLSQNWCHGKYDERIYFKHDAMYPSQIMVEKNLFYMTHGGQLRIHRRLNSQNLINERVQHFIGNTRDGDITGFVKNGDTIFGGRDNGYAFIYENGEYFVERICDEIGQRRSFINAVDFRDNVFATASMTSMKIWRKMYELEMVTLLPLSENDTTFKCLKICPSGLYCAAGKYIDRLKEALRIFDIETNTERIIDSKTGSVYDLLWKDNSTILTANYDSSLRLVDIRSNNEQVWMDPYDSSIYSLDYDRLNGVLCGMMYHCRVNLFDLRMPRKFVQIYFPSLENVRGSPAYSIACDASQLFIATDHNLRILNFDADYADPRDYANIFNHG